MSLPMPSGSCWTKRTTESNRKAPEILRGFFAPYPPADASCRTSGYTPPNPLTIGFPVTQAQAQTHTPQPPSPLSSSSLTPPFPHISPIQALLPPQSPAHPTLSCHAGTDPHAPATPARYPRRSPAPPFPHGSPLQPRSQSKARLTPRFPATQAQIRTPQPSNPLPSSLTNSPIPAHLSSPSDLYKNPGSRPPPGFFVISGSVRSPSQQRLR